VPLTLITGRANTGKTGRALAIYRDALASGDTPVLILPASPDVARMKAELSAAATLGVSVTTFDKYVAGCWEELGDGRRIVSPAQRRALVERVLVKQQIPGAGMARLVARVIQHVASGGDAWRSLPEIQGAGSPVADAVREYAAELQEQGLIEGAEAATCIARLLDTTIIFHRFSDLTPSEESFILNASCCGAHVVVTLTWEEGFSPTEFLDPLIVRLSETARREHIAASATHTADIELRRIEAELFENPVPTEMSGSVVFLMGEGPEAEADVIVGRVRELIEDGIAPELIAVVFRSLRTRAGVLRRAFSEAHIHADIDMSTKFAEISFGRAFSHAVSFVAEGRRSDLLALVRSGYFCDETEATSSVTRGWLSGGIHEVDKLLAQIRGFGSWQQRVLRTLRTAGQDLEKDALLWDELATRMFTQRHGGSESADLDLSVDAGARTGLTRLLDDLRVLRGQKLDAEILKVVLAEHSIGTRHVERVGHVQVTSAERVRGRRFTALVLGGLTAGEFPLVSEDPLNSDVLKALWTEAGVGSPTRRDASAERALLYAVVSRPREYLALARPLTEATGDAVGASVFWHELRDFYRRPGDEGEEVLLDEDYVLEAYEAGLAPRAASSRRVGLRADACRIEKDSVSATSDRVAAAVIRTRKCVSRDVGETLDAFSDTDTFSPSALETYARCPYLWFLTRAVKLRSVEFEVDALLSGTLVHSALEGFYRERL